MTAWKHYRDARNQGANESDARHKIGDTLMAVQTKAGYEVIGTACTGGIPHCEYHKTREAAEASIASTRKAMGT